MTGLAGIIALVGTLDAGEAVPLVEAMAQAQQHRAPAGWGVAVHPRIVHMTAREPATRDARSADGSGRLDEDATLVAFDGVITNRDRVHEGLARVGIALNGAADPECVRHAWKMAGPRCLARIDGRFAFVLHHPAGTYLVRDRYGHKPLHYAVRGARLYFASEAKALLAVLGAPAPDERALLEWSLYGDLLPPRTLFRGLYSVAPGHLLEIGPDGRVGEPRAYYDPADVVDSKLAADYAGQPIPKLMSTLEATIEHAISSHMDARSDVAVMLSGGVDSTVIAALAKQVKPLTGYNFSIARNKLLDERPMAATVAKQLGIPLEGVSVDGDTYRRELARTTYEYEMPLWHMQGVPIQLLARRARQDGVGLLLSGVSVGPLLGAASDRYRWILPQPALDLVSDDVFRVVRKALYSAAGLPVANPFFTQTLAVGLQLIDGGARSALVGRHEQAYRFIADDRERRIHVMRMTDNVLFLRRFFHQGDRLCGAASLEYCDAAVDADFHSLAFNIPAAVMYRNKSWKWILKELATKYVARDVAFQKKIPLDVPVDEYFAPQFKASLFQNGFLASYLGIGWEAAQGMVASARERAPVLLRLVNIEVWGRLFFMGQSVDEVTSLLCR